MLYAEFRRHLGKAGMTINDFAAYLCIRPASVSNYSKSGSVPRTYAIIAILLGEAADRGINGAQLLNDFGVAPHSETRSCVGLDSEGSQSDMTVLPAGGQP